jgi:DNA polymerase IV
MPPGRSILHVDMDAFFAAVEMLDYPSLRGKALLVGHDGPRGVVAAASYEARQFGCHSAQPMAVAKRMCPHAVVVPGRHERYREVSRRVFEIFDAFSPAVEPLSIDEAFLDLTGTEKLQGPPESVAARIKQRIKGELGLTASVGVAPNKFLAKLASDLDKPDGLVVIRPNEIATLLAPLPVTKLWGVGPATAGRLAEHGIRTIADIRSATVERLAQLLGGDATRMSELSRGVDERPVVPDGEAKSIGHEQTFGVDLAEPEALRRILFEQVEAVARRLRKHGVFARGVTVKLRYGDFETITRSTTMKQPTQTTNDLWAAAVGLFDAWAATHFRPVRLIGATATHLGAAEAQLALFVDPAKETQKKLDAVADRIAKRFGTSAIRRAGGMDAKDQSGSRGGDHSPGSAGTGW